MAITIYHNPRCSKSRQTLALLTAQGLEPEIIEYLSSPPSRVELKEILQKLDLRPRDIIRKGEVIYKELELADDQLSDDQLITAMAAHPILIERPIVVNGAKAALGRPPKQVLGIL